MRQVVQISHGPLLAQTELSGSQQDFFKMLDEKINNGPDYDPICEYEFGMEPSKLCQFLQEWNAVKQRSAQRGPAATRRTLTRYHSLQSNGEVVGPGGMRKGPLHHQMSVAAAHNPYPHPPAAAYYAFAPPPPGHPHHYAAYEYAQHQHQLHQGPPPPSYYHHHQFHPPAPPPPPSSYHIQNSVVLYDKSRGGYYTELA